MFTRLKYFLSAAMRIKPGDNVPKAVAEHFQHNVIINTVDISFFLMADSFWSINTIMPVFAATLTDSAFLIGLMPAIVNAGWFLPQMFMASRVSRLPKVMPMAAKLGFLERVPYLFFPILAITIPHISKSAALAALILLMVWRGVGGGLSALPWQEIMARVIPITHRARFFGFSRVLGQLMGVLGSAILAVILARLPYPYNYALGFGIAAILQWISFAAFTQNREPDQPPKPAPAADETHARDFNKVGQILRHDGNFRLYLAARSLSFLGNMATAFLAVYAIQAFHLGDGHAAIFTGLLFASGIVGYAVWGAIGDRIGPKKIVVIALAAWAAGLLIAVLTQTIWVYYLVFVAFGLYNAGVSVGDSMLVMELGHEHLRPTYLGVARTLTGSFLLIAPILAGWLVQSFSYRVMFITSIAFTLISIVMMNGVKDAPRGRPHPGA